MQEKSLMHESIMQRVRFIFFVRKFGTPVVAEVVVLSAAVLILMPFVSIGNIVTNSRHIMAGGSILNYFYSALTHTELFVQIVTVVTLVCTGYLLVRGFVEVFRMVRPIQQSTRLGIVQ